MARRPSSERTDQRTPEHQLPDLESEGSLSTGVSADHALQLALPVTALMVGGVAADGGAAGPAPVVALLAEGEPDRAKESVDPGGRVGGDASSAPPPPGLDLLHDASSSSLVRPSTARPFQTANTAG